MLQAGKQLNIHVVQVISIPHRLTPSVFRSLLSALKTDHPYWCNYWPIRTHQTFLPVSSPTLVFTRKQSNCIQMFDSNQHRQIACLLQKRMLTHGARSRSQASQASLWYHQPSENVNKCLPISLPLALSLALAVSPSFISKLINSDAFFVMVFHDCINKCMIQC